VQQIENYGFQRRCALQTLQHHEPQHHQWAIDRVIESAFGLPVRLLNEVGRKDFLKERKNPGNRRLRRLKRT
jgi:hypothetical protein